jgi:hypothetical protein
MTKSATALFLLISLFGCKEKPDNGQTIKYVQANHENINDSLENYFTTYEIKPQVIVNNVDQKQTKVSFLNHNIEWLERKEEPVVRIDDNLISLKKEVTLNNVWGNEVDSVNFVNNWNQIKYFKFNDEEIIGIRMNNSPCTGLGCSIDYFLLYDLKRKSKSFFGTFRTDRELKLYHFNNNPQVDYLSKTYDGETDGVAKEIAIIYELYSLADNGQFELQKDKQGKPYYIKHVLPVVDTSNIKETMEMHWFERF